MAISVRLPAIPKGKALEEFVSAFYQVGGRYVERNIVQREVEEVLELDVVDTNHGVSPLAYTLTEVKSGNWGFSDLFKLRGWLDYLHLENAVFVATKTKKHLESYREIAKELSIQVVVLPDLTEAGTHLAGVMGIQAPCDLDLNVWRLSHWMDRTLASNLIHKKKSTQNVKRYLALAEYLHEVNSGAFFQRTVSERMAHLCGKYKEHPNISKNVAAEMKGKSFDGHYERVHEEVFRQAFRRCEYNDLQASCFVEHRARLALMKYATDFLLLSQSGRTDRAVDSQTVRVLGSDISCSSFDSLPTTFRDGIERIKDEPYFHRYPVFWQWFMWAYGGFILLDKEEEEYAHMAARTGMPVEAVPRALEAYDALFPTPNTWFADLSSECRIRVLKLFPVPFMGLGAFYRQRIYCGQDSLASLAVTGKHTVSKLAKWKNAAVAVLRR